MTLPGRREFLLGVAGLGASLAARALGAQQQQRTNFAPMSRDAYHPTLRAPKPDASPSMPDRARDALEHELKCQCGCTLDVYTCRTTDFSCEVSPAMHRDVVRLVEGGYGAGEILAAFVETYGEIALTAPPKRGFNWVAYLAPGVAMLTGGVLLTNLIKKRGAIADAVSPQPSLAASVQAPDGVSAEDLVRLDRALREED